MAVTKQTYTANATWAASQLADLFRSAFIDSGLMADWHDSFTSSGVENRILRIVYDNTKTYGTTFYWFVFTTSGAFVSISSGWNTTTKVPSGTLYLDFFNAATNTSGNHYSILSLSATTKVELFSYQSLVSPGVTWFLLKQGSSSQPFMIFPSTSQIVPWIDLNRTLFHHFVTAHPYTSSLEGGISFNSRGALRRSYVMGTSLLGSSGGWSMGAPLSVSAYACSGKGNNLPASNFTTFFNSSGGTIRGFGFTLPIGSNTANPAYATDSNPVFTGMPISLYVNNCTIPADFGLIPHYANNTMVVQDKFIVSAGVEEWEILAVANNSTAVTGVTISLAARVVG